MNNKKMSAIVTLLAVLAVASYPVLAKAVDKAIFVSNCEGKLAVMSKMIDTASVCSNLFEKKHNK